MSAKPTIAQFRDFFAAVNAPPGGSAEKRFPFPWQENLLAEVAQTGRWPGLLDLPTGAGKTAVIDIAVFLMALRADAPRRIVFVIDRKVVVQQAAERARRLARELVSNPDPAVRAVAASLRKLAADAHPESPPLQWAELRGGIVRDESWALRPDVPAVLVSTVDQVGSRLLFRGYGLSQGMGPVHAGLLGADALYFLDEVHLAQPFAETLRSISSRFRPPADAGLPDRWQVTELSATPGAEAPHRTALALTDRDRDPAVTPVLARRISAEKIAVKHLVRGRALDQRHALAEEAARQARQAITQGQAVVAGIVLNRVDTARQAYDLLDSPDFDRVLLTGRMRPLDRDDLLSAFTSRICTGRERIPGDKPLAVVGTQSVEAGADYDFDILITECASFDALRQRFGRVDRDGQLSLQQRPSRSVILALPDQVDSKGNADPVYGAALSATWQYLPDGPFDFARLAPVTERMADLVAPKPQAPVLLRSHLDRWVQTYPYPDADPDISLWLHGLDARQADVSLVWRADLAGDLLVPGTDGAELAVSLVTACRPGPGEAMTVPVQAVRAWLARLAGADQAGIPVADVEGAGPGADAQLPPGSQPIRPVLRWSGDDSAVAARASDIRPGSTLIVPAAYGGLRDFNWDPGSREPVADLGHRVHAEQRQIPLLRLHREVLGPQAALLPELPRPADPDADEIHPTDAEIVAEWLTQAQGALDPGTLTARIVTALSGNKERTVTRLRVGLPGRAGDAMFVVSSPKRQPSLAGSETVDTEPATSAFTGIPVPLAEHLDHVKTWAASLAESCGLPPRLAADLTLAGWLHDTGKADPRFQAMLRQGRLADAGLLAKSGLPAASRADRERARREAGYPRTARHELLSVALVQDDASLAATAHDWDLVLHLIASHHGYCRPFAPAADDLHPDTAELELEGRRWEHSTATTLARLDSGVADRFWRLVRRYGWFGLAWLECILRLADHRASAAEQLTDSNVSRKVEGERVPAASGA